MAPASPSARRPRTASCCAATTRGATASAREALVQRHLPLVRVAGPPLRRPRRGARRHRAGRRDRPDQGDRPLRAVARGGADHLRDAERGRRDQAPLPRQGLGDPRAARAAGAERQDGRRRSSGSPPSSGAPRASPRSPGVRRPRRSRCSRRWRPDPPTRPRRCRPARRDDGDLDPMETIGSEDAEFERTDERTSLEPALELLPAARARNPADALRGRSDPDADRRADRHLPDARFASHPQVTRAHASRAFVAARLNRGSILEPTRRCRQGV